MYEDVTGVFSEILRQQSVMRNLVNSLSSNDVAQSNTPELTGAKNALDHLTIKLTQIGRKHFMMPAGSEEAA